MLREAGGKKGGLLSQHSLSATTRWTATVTRMFLNSFPLSDMAEALELQGVAEVSQSSTAALKRSERGKHPSITQ